jgi:Holliday junction resolvase
MIVNNVKRKGSQGERELSEILRQNQIRAYRNDQIFTGGKGNPDVSAEISGRQFHVEVKRVERLNVNEAMNQAIRDAAEGVFPVLAHRRNREQWLVTMPLIPLLELLKNGGFIENDE